MFVKIFYASTFLLHSFLKACFDMIQLILLFAFCLQCVAQLGAHVKGHVLHIGKYFSAYLLKIFYQTFSNSINKKISIINFFDLQLLLF